MVVVALVTESDDTPPVDGVEPAVLRDLAAMPEVVRRTTEAATALALARELDRGRLMSTAPVAKELRTTMEQLRVMTDQRQERGDGVDDLAAARAARRAAAALSERPAAGDVSGPGGR